MDEKRPNILFLMTDEQRFDHLGRVNPAVKTPHLDALANDGVLFSRAYTPNPFVRACAGGNFYGKISTPVRGTHLYHLLAKSTKRHS